MGLHTNAFIVGIAGGTASGKTTLAQMIAEELGAERCAIVGMDSYYHDRSGLFPEEKANINYDHPDEFDMKLIVEHLFALKRGEEIAVPQYDYATSERAIETIPLAPKEIVLFEGILTFTDLTLNAVYDTTLFVSADERVRFERRLARDTAERGRTPESVERQWSETVKPMHDQFCGPSQCVAARTVNGESDFRQIVPGLVRDLTQARDRRERALQVQH